MSIKTYQKAEIKIQEPVRPVAMKEDKPKKKKVVIRKKREKHSDAFNRSSKVAKVITQALSVFLVLIGVAVIMYSSFPYVRYYFEKLGSNNNEEALVSGGSDPSVLSLQSRYSPQYFENVDKNIALVAKELQTKTGDYTDVDGEFLLSIPKIGVDKVPVKLNVDSFSKEEYDQVLKSRLAHFQGSSIPGELGTTFVYGHSTAEWYAEANPGFFGAVFTYLTKVNLGDEIFIEYEGQNYRYVVTRVYEIEPDDLSPVFENDGRKLLKLMTCSPPGIATNRLIVVAEQI